MKRQGGRQRGKKRERAREKGKKEGRGTERERERLPSAGLHSNACNSQEVGTQIQVSQVDGKDTTN